MQVVREEQYSSPMTDDGTEVSPIGVVWDTDVLNNSGAASDASRREAVLHSTLKIARTGQWAETGRAAGQQQTGQPVCGKAGWRRSRASVTRRQSSGPANAHPQIS